MFAVRVYEAGLFRVFRYDNGADVVIVVGYVLTGD
jgi:hypothetical protein